MCCTGCVLGRHRLKDKLQYTIAHAYVILNTLTLSLKFDFIFELPCRKVGSRHAWQDNLRIAIAMAPKKKAAAAKAPAGGVQKKVQKKAAGKAAPAHDAPAPDQTSGALTIERWCVTPCPAMLVGRRKLVAIGRLNNSCV